MVQIFDRRWILDTNALSYIAERDRQAPHEAALILQSLIVDQKVGMRPIDGDEDWSFFRFATPDPNGGAYNVKHRKRLERFEVNSQELLAALPAAVAPAEGEEPKEPAPDQATPVGRKTTTKLAQVTEAMTRLWPDHNAPADRKVMATALEEELKQSISPKTLDRARKSAGFPKLRQKSPNVV